MKATVEKKEEGRKKVPYGTPQLTVHGDVAKITEAKVGGPAEQFDGSG